MCKIIGDFRNRLFFKGICDHQVLYPGVPCNTVKFTPFYLQMKRQKDFPVGSLSMTETNTESSFPFRKTGFIPGFSVCHKSLSFQRRLNLQQMCYIGTPLIGKNIESVPYVCIITLKKLAREFGLKELILFVKWKKYCIINIEANHKAKLRFSSLKLH